MLSGYVENMSAGARAWRPRQQPCILVAPPLFFPVLGRQPLPATQLFVPIANASTAAQEP
jgi:hypothetical protein